MSSVMLSSASLRSGTLAPPSTATNGANITRADFQRWAHEDRNHAQADATRSEREERRRFKQAQKELFRSRGAAIKEQHKEQMQEAIARVNEHKQEAQAGGTTLREESARMKARRIEQSKKWADHGYELTQQYTIKAAQNNMRSLKAQNAGIVNGMHAKKQDRQAVCARAPPTHPSTREHLARHHPFVPPSPAPSGPSPPGSNNVLHSTHSHLSPLPLPPLHTLETRD